MLMILDPKSIKNRGSIDSPHLFPCSLEQLYMMHGRVSVHLYGGLTSHRPLDLFKLEYRPLKFDVCCF